MIFFILIALLMGIFCGQGLLGMKAISFISENNQYLLYLLVLSVGISLGGNREIVEKLRKTDSRVWMLPIGVVTGSLLGGMIASLLNTLPLSQNLSISSGLGWYSLSGVLLNELYGSEVGAIGFLSNLFREVFSFMLIPVFVRYLNPYAAIAICGSTSEDTTLPFLIRCTSSEFIVYAVINGIVTSACVPVLIRILSIIIK